MKVIVALHGKTKDKRVLDLLEEYTKKISRYQKIELIFLPLSEFTTHPGSVQLRKILEKFDGSKVYLLDEDGKEYTSLKFAENYEKDLNNAEKEVVFVVGPAKGFGEVAAIKLNTHLQLISLSKMAMQHDLASLVLVEQIYRSVSIKNNLPYHKV